MNASTRNISSTYSSRVRSHSRRRNGIVVPPRDHSTSFTPQVATMYGWRAFG